MAKRESIYTKDVILVMIASFCFMFSNMYCNPLINGYAQKLGASSTFAGVIAGMMSLVAMFLRPIAGNLTDRISKYRLASWGGLLSFIGVTGYVLCTVCMTTWLASLVPLSHVGEAMGLYGIMNALAMAFAPAVSINLYHVIGYRPAIIISAAAALLVAVIVQFVSDRSVPVKKSRSNGSGRIKIIQKSALPVAAMTALFAIPYFATQADIVTYVEQRHLTVAVGAYFMIYAAVLLVIRLCLRTKFDTVRFGKWLIVSLLANVFYLIMLSIMKTNWEMALAAAGMALGYGIIYSVCQSTALMLAPQGEQGLASSTFFLGVDIGMTLGPVLGGLIDQYLPLKAFYPVMLLIVPIIFLIYLGDRKELNGAVAKH